MVHRVGRVSVQAHPVETGRGCDAIRVVGSRPDGEWSTHAVPHATGNSGQCGGVDIGVVEQGTHIARHHAVPQSTHQLGHASERFAAREVEFELPCGAVVQVGQHHVIATLGDGARHGVQQWPLAGRIHEEQHHRPGAVTDGMHHEGAHLAFTRGDVGLSFDEFEVLTHSGSP